MKIDVEFLGLPNLTRAINAKQVQLELSSGTTQTLLDKLIKTYGTPVKKALYDAEGKLDNTIQVLRNGKEWIKLDTKLNDNDKITFMIMVAGG